MVARRTIQAEYRSCREQQQTDTAIDTTFIVEPSEKPTFCDNLDVKPIVLLGYLHSSEEGRMAMCTSRWARTSHCRCAVTANLHPGIRSSCERRL